MRPSNTAPARADEPADFYRIFYRNFYRTSRNGVEPGNTVWHAGSRKPRSERVLWTNKYSTASRESEFKSPLAHTDANASLNSVTAELVARYLAGTYPNAGTRETTRTRLEGALRGLDSPNDLTPEMVIMWCTHGVRSSSRPLANNTVRSRASVIRQFAIWCIDQGIDLSGLLPVCEQLRRSHPRLYGAAQAIHPPQWLSHDQALGQLVGACRDGAWMGSRDQLMIRWGLLGLRNSELCGLTWGHARSDGTWHWIGKGKRTRTVTPGTRLVSLMERWRRAYEAGLGRPIAAEDPILCKAWADGRILWGRPVGDEGLRRIMRTRAEAAGLPRLVVHDTRRSAAGIMHHDLTGDGGHKYDLVDIQRVLDHANPTVTERSYLAPMSSGLKARAGALLD